MSSADVAPPLEQAAASNQPPASDVPGEDTEKKNIDLTEHLKAPEEVANELGASIDVGLPAKIAEERLQEQGPNSISPPKKISPFRLYLQQLLGLFNVLLLVASALSFILYIIDSSTSINVILGGVLIVVAFANAFIDFYQRYRTAALLESFLSLVPPETNVVRESSIKPLPAADLVLGDVVFLRSGDKVPADVRLFHVTDMKVDNSSITGESEAQERSLVTAATNPLEASNLAFSGTTVVNGEGYGIVIRTGDRSVLGQIAKLTIGEKTPQSQLTVEIEYFVRILACVAVITAIILFIIGFIKGYEIGIVFSFAIGIFVAYVPQGLPVTVSTLLTIAAKRMAKRNVLVKNLHAVETLGSITLLATDKTGTLTQNKMTVVGCWLNDSFYSTQALVEESELSAETPNLPLLLQCCALCTKSKFDSSETDKPLDERTILGDATEIGLLRFACKYMDAPAEQETYPKAFEVPFSSQTKWHMTVHKIESPNSQLTAIVKGAPERVAKMCNAIQVGDEIFPWTTETDSKFDMAYKRFAINGRRVIGFARQVLPSDRFPLDHEFKRDPLDIPLDSFVFLGLVAIMDPPKHGVRKAVAACRTAGIQVVMVTGDHPLTAEAIAKQIGLISGDTIVDASLKLQKAVPLVTEDEYDAVVVHGEKLESFTDEDWDRVLNKQEIVFARTSPKQKLEIVTRFQNKGHIVGVSGDGVNDSPALKKADLGISMNVTASDVSKEAASMILLDDNFPSIVHGIAEGRLIFANLKKSIRYTLTHMLPEVSAFVFFIVLAIPLPINSILVLLIDLGSELGSALSFAFEPPEDDLMLVPPRKVLCLPKPPKPDPDAAVHPEKRFCWSRKPKKLKPQDIEAPVITSAVPEEAVKEPPGKIRSSFTRLLRRFQRTDTGEVLVDFDLLFWCICEGGVFEALGAFGAYLVTLAIYRVPFDMLVNSAKTYWKSGAPPIILTNGQIATADDQIAISGSSQSAYYMGIVMCQLFVLWLTKHRFSYPYGRDMLQNKYTYIGMAVSISVAAIVIYVPGINDTILKGGPVPIAAYGPPFVAGVLLYAYEFLRRFLRRRGFFGGMPKANRNLIELITTTTSATGRPQDR